MEDQLQEFICHWRHGPSPGLTYYKGKERVTALDREQAEERARRRVAQRGCFAPSCITITKVEFA